MSDEIPGGGERAIGIAKWHENPDLQPLSPIGLLARILECIDRGEHAEVVRMFEFKGYPEELDFCPFHLYSRSLFEMGRYAEAERIQASAPRFRFEEARTHQNLARIRLKLGREAQAVRDCNKAMVIDRNIWLHLEKDTDLAAIKDLIRQ